MKTLYITDMDGTFLNNDGVVSGKSRKLINELSEKGVLFSVATSRSIMSAGGLLDGVKISAPAVLMSGVFVYDIENKRAVKFFSLDDDTFNKVLSIFDAHRKSPFVHFYDSRNDEFIIEFTKLRLQVHKDFYYERRKLIGDKIRQVDCVALKDFACPVFLSLCDEYEDLLPVTKELDETETVGYSFYKDTYTKYWFLEVFNREASKAKGLEIVKAYTGADRAVAFGDNLNDIPLFNAADECYAVKNAVSKLKEIATGVIDENEKEGVARFIYEREKSR